MNERKGGYQVLYVAIRLLLTVRDALPFLGIAGLMAWACS